MLLGLDVVLSRPRSDPTLAPASAPTSGGIRHANLARPCATSPFTGAAALGWGARRSRGDALRLPPAFATGARLDDAIRSVVAASDRPDFVELLQRIDDTLARIRTERPGR
jgi:hypothetical protein